MNYNKEELCLKLKKWEEAFNSYKLPEYEELPELNLYMDQVIILMNKYLSIYSKNSEKDKLITPSIINNYVKMNIIPSPVKKKYSKIHLIYLIMVCTLKQTLTISTIKNIIPLTDDMENLKAIYGIFKECEMNILKKTASKFSKLIEVVNENKENTLFLKEVLDTALAANAHKLFTEQITELLTNSKKDKQKKEVD